MSVARLISLKLSQHRVRVKVRGKWKNATKGAGSFVVPKAATEYRVEYKPHKRWLVVKTVKGKGKSKRYIGPAKLRAAMQHSDHKKRPYKTVFEQITKDLDENPWQLRPRAQRALPQWVKGAVFFNDVADLSKVFTQVAVWYAVESEGFSDGSTPADVDRVWYVDAAYMEVEKGRIKSSMLQGFSDLVGERVIGVKGEARQHNAGPHKYKWKETYRLLGVEGVHYEVSRIGNIRRTSKRTRTRNKVQKARPNSGVRYRNRKR